jgi:hypothetical protein
MTDQKTPELLAEERYPINRITDTDGIILAETNKRIGYAACVRELTVPTIDKLEYRIQDLIDDAPTVEETALLKAIEKGTEGHSNRLAECLGAALNEASDRCGYSSPEYQAIDAIIHHVVNNLTP